MASISEQPGCAGTRTANRTGF